MKNVTFFLIFVLILIGSSSIIAQTRLQETLPSQSNTPGQVTPEKALPPPVFLELKETKFAPGASIVVNFKAPNDLPGDAWVGIIPSHVPHGSEFQNDQYDLAYQYLNQRTQGGLTFNAPFQGGHYDFRMNSTDNNGIEIASVSFSVEGTVEPSEVKPTLGLTKQTFSAREEIVVQFTAPAGYALDAWIGIIPSYIPHGKESKNDQYDLSYQYLNNRTEGTLTFLAPATKGNYDLRMNNTDKDGLEVATVSFKVL
ncbi:MAG: hypothetical protein ACD_73C00801G0008 [uncultured bacterium]|nr:MAG: hypothetical protein ACD_73C00801G0008 [uncultured bacterium]